MSFRLNTVVLTGASSGIGEELAYQLASEGAWLTLAARNQDKLEMVAERCRILGSHESVRVQIVPTDVTDEAQCRHLIQQTVDTYGRLDTLINNAGIMVNGLVEDMVSMEPFHKAMAVNFYGAVHCTLAALPHIKQHAGRIAAVSSLLGKAGAPSYSAYSASKFAMTGFFESLRMELHDSQASVTLLYPGGVNTGMHQRGLGADGEKLDAARAEAGDSGMDVEKCAKKILQAIDARRREERFNLYNQMAFLSSTFAPVMLDYAAKREIEKRGLM